MDTASRNIRRQALQKIAALSATSSIPPYETSDLDKLSKGCPKHGKVNGNSNGHANGGSGSLAGSPMVQRLLALGWEKLTGIY